MKTYSNTGEKTGFGDAKEDSGDEKTLVVFDDSHERHHDAPCDHDCGQPATGTEFLQHEVAGDFECAIGEEEDGETPVVLRAGESQIGGESFDVGVANVPT